MASAVMMTNGRRSIYDSLAPRGDVQQGLVAGSVAKSVSAKAAGSRPARRIGHLQFARMRERAPCAAKCFMRSVLGVASVNATDTTVVVRIGVLPLGAHNGQRVSGRAAAALEASLDRNRRQDVFRVYDVSFGRFRQQAAPDAVLLASA
jgi:hypothetical protein